jgi:hypothetical protein
MIKRLVRTIAMISYDNAEVILGATLVPWAAKQLSGQITSLVGRPTSNWLINKILSNKAIDGAILRGINIYNNSGAKFAMRNGLPGVGERRLAIENEPHALDGFDGVIKSGYGKGTKKIVYKGNAIMKVKGISSVTEVEYHIHQADRAGLHFDLAIGGLPKNSGLFELNIGRGSAKGRYSFVPTEKGYIVSQMKDRGISNPKPTYNLKQDEFIHSLDADQDMRDKYIVERKLDGSLGNVLVYENRAIIHSHRESAMSYYDKLPSLEFLQNKSPYYLSRKLFQGPDIDGTIFRVELVHEDGVGVVSGILNSSCDNAVLVQKKIGPVKAYVWDTVKVRGKDISLQPYSERAKITKQLVNEIRLFNSNWLNVDSPKESESIWHFYQRVINDKRGLPYSEGIVIKSKTGVVKDSWYKAKTHDLLDMRVLEFRPGEGKYVDQLGSILAQDLNTGNIAIVGTGYNDFERKWIWEYRDLLSDTVIKAKVFSETTDSFRAPRFIEFHPDPRVGNNEAALLLYADVLSGLDNKEQMLKTKYALIHAN